MQIMMRRVELFVVVCPHFSVLVVFEFGPCFSHRAVRSALLPYSIALCVAPFFHSLLSLFLAVVNFLRLVSCSSPRLSHRCFVSVTNAFLALTEKNTVEIETKSGKRKRMETLRNQKGTPVEKCAHVWEKGHSTNPHQVKCIKHLLRALCSFKKERKKDRPFDSTHKPMPNIAASGGLFPSSFACAGRPIS